MSYSIIFILSSYFLLTLAFNETVPKMFFNKGLEDQNPSSNCPPSTDSGAMPPFKYPFAFTHLNSFSGGWVRSLTQDDLPISTKIAGIITRIYKGAIRELHWHVYSELAYIIYGTIRLTVVDEQGRAFVEDVKGGDVWFIPAGLAHGLQVISDEGTLALAVFNNGNLNGNTFLLTNWMNLIPKEILAKNFQVPISVFANIPPKPPQIFPGQIPQQSLAAERAEVTKGTGYVPQSFLFSTERFKPNITRRGGEALIVDARNFPITKMASVIVKLKPGAMRELHWHPDSNEWQYYITGNARMGLFNAGSAARTMDFQAGDVGYIPQSFGHYIENTGNQDLIFLEVFDTPYYEDISLAEWLAHTYPSLVNQHIRTGETFIRSIRKTKAVILP